MIKKVFCTTLAILHILTTGPIRDAFAVFAKNNNYQLTNLALDPGGNDKSSAGYRISLEVIGQPYSANNLSTNSYVLLPGYTATFISNPPVLRKPIPNQSWKENTSLTDAFDLDDYFYSPDSLPLRYTLSGNKNIKIEIKQQPTKLLLHADGKNDSTTFKDEAGHIITPHGNVHIDTPKSKFGGASIYFDGSGDYLSISDSDDWHFGSADWTIVFWVNTAQIGNYQGLIHQMSSTKTYSTLQIHDNGKIVFQSYKDNKLLFIIGSTSAITAGNWYHIALVHKDQTYTIYINGKKEASITTTHLWEDYTGPLEIAKLTNTINDSYYFYGWIDELRISKGIARWTSDFNPPSNPYSVDPDNTVSFSQPQAWNGTEKIKFTAIDLDLNATQSNEITLQVEGVENDPVIQKIKIEPSKPKEGDLVTVTVKATDLDLQDLSFTYSDLFTEKKKWQENNV